MYKTIIFPLRGVEIHTTAIWLPIAVALLAISIYVTIPGRFAGESLLYQTLLTATILVGLTVSLALHEIAHVLVARRVAGDSISSSPQLAGALPDTLFEARDPQTEVKVGLAGPIVSWALAAVAGLGWWVADSMSYRNATTVLGLFALVNLGLAVINLMPGYPFDGGRIARGVFWFFNENLMTATKIVGYSGYLLIMAAMAIGALLVVSGGNLSVWGVWVLLTAFMINRSVGAGVAHVFWTENSHRLRVDDLFVGGTRRIQRHVTIDEAIERLLEGHDDGPMLVVEGRTAIGLVDLASIRPVPRKLWTEREIGDVMTPIDGLESTTSVSPLSELIELLPPEREHEIALITRDGAIIGATDRRDVVRRLQQYLAAERLDQMRRGRRSI